MRKRQSGAYILLVSFCLLLSPLIYSQSLRVQKTYILNLPPVNKEATVALWKQDFAPPEIFEGLKGELILNRFAYLQIYTPEGEMKQTIGGYGQGPGEFYGIGMVKKSADNYFILDPLLGSVSVFDDNFIFKRRIFLNHEGVSNIIQDISISDNYLAAAQFKREVIKDIRKNLAINLYDLNGKWLKALFDLSKVQSKLRNYPETFLRGHIFLDEQNIYFCLMPINYLWKLNFNGQILEEKRFGQKWWRYIEYDYPEKRKFSLKKPAWQYDIQAEETGYRIIHIFEYEDYICLQISMGNEDILNYCYVLINKELSWESKPFYLKGYFPAGNGNACLYLVRMLEFSSPFEPSKGEVIKCLIEKAD